ncbi:MAG: hypothetical protein LDL24_06485 [Treponema sp.]|nr:hypothetical protein [Treponema sp.]
MKRSLFLWFHLACIFSAGMLMAQNTTVVYLEGEPQHKNSKGVLAPLDYGRRLSAGESVITGKKDLAELDQGSAAVIRIKPNTVFTIREVETGGQKEQVLSTVVGSVSMKFNRLAGKEPRVGTVSTIAGIRGTELTVFAGPDGSSLFIVQSGLVSVTAEGKTVDLGEQEAVEVPAGGPPGEKYSVIGRELDFSAWAQEKAEALRADPLAALERTKALMEQFKAGLAEWVGKYESARVESEAAAKTMAEITDKEAQGKYRDEVWFPLALQTGSAILNYRYYTLSALSLRRYVLGPLYMQVRSRNMVTKDSTYEAFMARYRELIQDFQETFEPYTNITDY